MFVVCLVIFSSLSFFFALKREKSVAQDFVSAFEVGRISGKDLFDRDCLICSFLDADSLPNDVIIDALLRTQGYSVKK